MRHDSSSSLRPPNRTALRSGSRTGSSSVNTTSVRAVSFPRNRARRAKLLVGVCGGTLDATVDDALAVSGVTLVELVIAFAFNARGFLSAERGGGGKRREGPGGVDEGECERAREAGGCRELGRGGVGEELGGEDTLRWRRGSGAGGYRCARCVGKWGVRERWSPMAICW